MSIATWGDAEPQANDAYPMKLLKKLLQQMMQQFTAQGGVLALYDETLGQMVVRLHLRMRLTSPAVVGSPVESEETVPLARHASGSGEVPASSTGHLRRLSQPLTELEEITVEQHAVLFPPGTIYAHGHDLIGYIWRHNEPDIIRHEEYLRSILPARQAPPTSHGTPTWYLGVPIQEPALATGDLERKRRVIGVVILYQVSPGLSFSQKHRHDASQFAERIALYLQNDQLQRSQQAMNSYMKQLQQISMAFPTAVQLRKLVEDVYAFVKSVIGPCSMLLTFYDRDTDRLYDVFAVDKGQPSADLPEHPLVFTPDKRPMWWHVAQEKKTPLKLSPDRYEPGASQYEELFKGTWGDQSQAASFLLLPMRMFTRVVGTLSLASARPDAFTPNKIQVLETMVQIITVSIENAKLYDRASRMVARARHREESLATMNSALQAISTVLNVSELLHKFVEVVGQMVKAEMCAFFQVRDNEEKLIARAIYDTSGKYRSNGGNKEKHRELIEMISLPFKGSLLSDLIESDTFFYLDENNIEELERISDEAGALFLRETRIKRMLMIPVRYQNEMVGILAVHTPGEDRIFRPEEVSALLAISAQAASAIRNAELFSQIQDANVELQRMDKLKDEFIVTASHELRTPLSAVSGYASLLKRQSTRLTPQQVWRYASKIGAAAQQITELVGNMTEAAKVGNIDKKLDLQLGPVQLFAAAEMATHMLTVSIEQEIKLQIDPNLWVYCDGLHLKQVLTNLLDNASKYSPPGTKITVMAHALKLSQLPDDQIDFSQLVDGNDPEVVLVRVCDEGEGIPLEDQEKIFDKFVRASRSLTTTVRGTGLGLYICRRYIEAMGGRLWLEVSIPGEGSVFSFYLPRLEAPVPMEESHDPEQS